VDDLSLLPCYTVKGWESRGNGEETMNRLRVAKLIAVVSVIVPLAVVFIWNNYLWTHLLFVIWVMGAALLWIRTDRQEQASRVERAVQSLQMTAIRTLNHHRHDWMNDLQVLYGYIRMQKPDRTIQCVERIRDRMVLESRIAKLGIPALIMFFQSFRTTSQSLQLDVTIEEDLNLAELPLDSETLTETIVSMVNAYRFAVKNGLGEAPRLVIGLALGDQKLLISFQFEGELGDSGGLHEQFKDKLAGTPLEPVSLEPSMMNVLLHADLRN